MTEAYEIIDHSYDVVIAGEGVADCAPRWAWRHRD